MQPIIVRSLVALTLIASGSVLAQTPPSGADSTRKPGPTVIPAAAPAEGEVTHVVKKGDTLWDIAKTYLKDPFRWPEVFRRNTDVVENPHWIYPGEVIRIPNSEVRPEVLARVTTQPAPVAPNPAAPLPTTLEPTVFSTRPALVSDRLQSSGQVLGRERGGSVRVGEVEAAPFADRQGGPHGAGRLAAAYDRPGIQAKASDQRFQLQDPIFVELPSGRPARLGDRYVAYILGPALSDESQLMIPTAIVQVENVQPGQLTLARVVRQFGDIRLDQLLAPLENAVPPATMSPMPVTNGRTAHVLWVHEDPVLPSMQSYVVLTRETGSDVQVGDQFTLIDASVDESHPAPPVPAAVAQVVRVTPYAVTALVVDHDQPTIRAGMPARLTARMR
ncbi:MAG TPA: LysM peptidoglycan-binding domain-containing protein [Gemmatimonadaceae bacterium]|jgi:LysM repeat protein